MIDNLRCLDINELGYYYNLHVVIRKWFLNREIGLRVQRPRGLHRWRAISRVTRRAPPRPLRRGSSRLRGHGSEFREGCQPAHQGKGQDYVQHQQGETARIAPSNILGHYFVQYCDAVRHEHKDWLVELELSQKTMWRSAQRRRFQDMLAYC